MSRTSERIRNYAPAKGEHRTQMSAFDAIQDCLNTLFDVRCSNKKKWGTDWYDFATHGCYDKAREELITKPACLSKSVALKCIDDLQRLQAELDRLEMRDEINRRGRRGR